MTEKKYPVKNDIKYLATLKDCLEKLIGNYGAEYLDTDPLGIVHKYTSQQDIETAGFIASALAFGGAPQIRKSVEKALSPAGDSPAGFAANLTPERADELFRGFYHRWTKEAEIAGLFLALGKIIRDYGSIGDFIRTVYKPSDDTIIGAMTGISKKIIEIYKNLHPANSNLVRNSGFAYLAPSPESGSACKRLAMYFRWMVRGPDGVDFGLWKFIPSSKLIIPLDRHIARMGKLLGLTNRKSPDLKMALEITDTLRLLDPDDPVKYDFALVRPGILGKCRISDQRSCSECELGNVCTEAG